MSIAEGFTSQGQAVLSGVQIGLLPDAPLAMPKQRLERTTPLWRGLLAVIKRPLFARTGRSEG